MIKEINACLIDSEYYLCALNPDFKFCAIVFEHLIFNKLK